MPWDVRRGPHLSVVCSRAVLPRGRRSVARRADSRRGPRSRRAEMAMHRASLVLIACSSSTAFELGHRKTLLTQAPSEGPCRTLPSMDYPRSLQCLRGGVTFSKDEKIKAARSFALMNAAVYVALYKAMRIFGGLYFIKGSCWCVWALWLLSSEWSLPRVAGPDLRVVLGRQLPVRLCV